MFLAAYINLLDSTNADLIKTVESVCRDGIREIFKYEWPKMFSNITWYVKDGMLARISSLQRNFIMIQIHFESFGSFQVYKETL